jgi:hypothetical protein
MRSALAAVPIAALALSARGARADDQEARDEAFEQAAAADAAEGAKAGLPLNEAAQAELGRIDERRKPPPSWGLLVSGGFPEGLAASVVWRPRSEIRLYAGPMWNYVGWGAQGGVTIIPWHTGISPFLSLEGGRYFQADASFLADNASGVPAEVKPLLTHVSYDYASAHLGIEIGTRDGFALVVEAGLSYLSLRANGTSTTQVDVSGTTATVAFTDPQLRGTMPSVRVGLQTWF